MILIYTFITLIQKPKYNLHIEEPQDFPGDDKDESVSVLHFNIRSINKSFSNFKMFLSNLKFSFS